MFDRVSAVFIDGGYFVEVRKYFNLYKIDFQKFSDILCEENNTERLLTFYYDCPPFQGYPPTQEEKERISNFDKFAYSLNRLPRFQIRLGKLSRRDIYCKKCGNREIKYSQKRVDNLLTVDITRAVWKDRIQKAILVTGDSDFVPAVEEANRAQVLTHVYYLDSPKTKIHDELYNACSERTEITQELLENAKI